MKRTVLQQNIAFDNDTIRRMLKQTTGVSEPILRIFENIYLLISLVSSCFCFVARRRRCYRIYNHVLSVLFTPAGCSIVCVPRSQLFESLMPLLVVLIWFVVIVASFQLEWVEQSERREWLERINNFDNQNLTLLKSLQSANDEKQNRVKMFPFQKKNW